MSECDISESLIKQTQETYPNMELFVGSIWAMGSRFSKKYDIVYCIRSSWYMKDFLRMVKTMLEMTKSNGYVVFNIIN